jgi:spermidine/putrescine transport system ATP-binding protein
MPAEVELTNVTKRFSDVVAVDDVSFEVQKNEFFSLLGPSGCGKTTTLRMIAGLEEPDQGTIKLRGNVINNVPPYKRHIGMVFQHLALFPHMNVYDNIAFGLKMQKFPKTEFKDRIHKMLDIMDMPPENFAKRRTKQLSGGQQQRVAMARALVTDPTVLLLDEPLGPLDLKIRQRMQIELKRIQRRVGTTFIYVTHDQGEALTMSDRIAVMDKGKIAQIGEAREIYTKPKTKFVAGFIGETNFIEGVCESCVCFEAKNLPSQIKVEAPEDFVKKQALLCIRPEKIFVGKNLKGIENIFEGKIEEYTYLGAFVFLRVRLTDDVVLRIQVQVSDDSLADFEVGDNIQIGWEKDNATVIPFEKA